MTPARWPARLLAAALLGVALLPGAPALAADPAGTSRPSPVADSSAPDLARAAYEQSRERVARVSAQSARLAASAAAAEERATELRAAVGDDDGGLGSSIGRLLGGDPDLERATEAAAEAAFTRELADLSAAGLADAIAGTEEALLAWQQAEEEQARREAGWSAREAIDAALRRSHLPRRYAEADPAQDARNRAALADWHALLEAMAAVGVAPPPAATLARPVDLPEPLEPVRDDSGLPQPGVARVDPPGSAATTVLPAETVRAVAEIFQRLGLPAVPGDGEPGAYACGGLVAHAWSAARSTLPADADGQWRDLGAVPRSGLQVGDVLVLRASGGGLGATGVHLGRGRMALADPETGTVGVQPLPARVLGVRRVAAPAVSNPAPPAGGACGDSVPAASAQGPLMLPVAPGSHTVTAGYGELGPLWDGGEHTGLDLAAPTGTTVVAAAAGEVTVEHPDWAGTLVRIDHGGGVETWYAHLSGVDVATGQRVAAGAPVGRVGARGNASGPHLHLEVRLDGEPVDPALVLRVPGRPRPEVANGAIPDSLLCAATATGGHLLACDAAVAYRLLAEAYAAELGTAPCATDSYRSLAGQREVHVVKPGLTATPGTSVHGLGRAVDLCGGAERFGTPEHTWLVEHGPTYGWVHPAWAGVGGSRPEPWHFEYAG